MKKAFALIILILVALTALTACNKELTFDDLIITADNVNGVEEGVYTMKYSIENISDYAEKHDVNVSVNVMDEKFKSVEVKNNRTFSVLKDKTYTVTVTVSSTVDGEYKSKKFSYTVKAVISPPTVVFKLDDNKVYKSKEVAVGSSYASLAEVYADLGVEELPPDYYVYTTGGAYDYLITDKKWCVYENGSYKDVTVDYFKNIRSSVTVVARYQRDTVAKILRLHFESEGGTEVSDITGNYGKTVAVPDKPTKENCFFAGWYEVKNNAEEYYAWSSHKTLTSSVTLHAKWVENNVSDPSYYGYFDFVLNTDSAYERDYYYVKAKDVAVLPKDLVIPSGYGNIPVEGIAPNGFRGAAIESVTLPNQNFNNASYAFAECASLVNVTYEGVKTVTTRFDTGMFAGCVSLTAITVPDAFTRISEKAFKDCTSLRSLVISGNSALISLGVADTYENTPQLIAVTLPKSFEGKTLPFGKNVVISYHS